MFSWVNNSTAAVRHSTSHPHWGQSHPHPWCLLSEQPGGQGRKSASALPACYLVGFQNEAHRADGAEALEQPPQSPEVTVFAERPSIDR